MVNEVNHPDELGGIDAIRQLPLVLQFASKESVVRYVIEDPNRFYSDSNYPRIFSDSTRVKWSKLQKLCETHGRVIKDEEYDSGVVCLSSMSKDHEYEIREYRYKSAA
ncbi:hypothetical protein HY212_05815 [Candidatus Pacearchaeota archaeon]|nr:hypothetical protein [Candidatus Pacearchaeota archaeon]